MKIKLFFGLIMIVTSIFVTGCETTAYVSSSGPPVYIDNTPSLVVGPLYNPPPVVIYRSYPRYVVPVCPPPPRYHYHHRPPVIVPPPHRFNHR